MLLKRALPWRLHGHVVNAPGLDAGSTGLPSAFSTQLERGIAAPEAFISNPTQRSHGVRSGFPLHSPGFSVDHSSPGMHRHSYRSDIAYVGRGYCPAS